MGLSYLGQLGVHLILRDACERIKSSGYSHEYVIDPYGLSVNGTGALALACGASHKGLVRWGGDLNDIPVVPLRWPLFMETLSFVESRIETDLDEFCSINNERKTRMLFSSCADYIEISVDS